MTDVEGCKGCAEHIFLLSLEPYLLVDRLLHGAFGCSAGIRGKDIAILREVAQQRNIPSPLPSNL